MTGRTQIEGMIVATAALGLLAAFGCASTPPPTEAVSVATFQLGEAEQSGAEKAAPLDVHLAREKIEKAEIAMEQEDYTSARRLAEQAFIDARIAQAKADRERTEASVEQLRSDLATFQEETERAREMR